MHLHRRWVCVLSLIASAATGAAQPPATPPNVILVTLDTVRVDRMGFMGSRRGLTPALDSLARASVVFTRAYSQVPLTTASHATILTGTYPQFHKVNDFGIPLAGDLPYAPDLLHARGYQTAAFVGSLILDPAAKSAPGFERGFDYFGAGYHRRRPGENRYQAIERRGEEVVARALVWLDQHPHGPFFLWLHLYDAHDPYEPPEPFKSRYSSAPYDGEIAYVDSCVGKFLAQLRARGRYNNSLIALMADHGEALGEHGEDTHGIFLYDETIHVPLLFKMPGERGAGRRVSDRVGLVDVLPTILQSVRAPIPTEVQGQSLVALAQAVKSGASANLKSALPDRPTYAESDYSHRTFGWSSLRALRTGKYLVIDAPRKELYDQSADPESRHDLSSSSSAVLETLQSQLSQFRQRTAGSQQVPASRMDPELQEKLSALGYVASNPDPTLPGVRSTGAEPKDKIEIVNLLHRAEMLEEGLHFAEAVPLLEQVVTREPDLAIAYLKLGTALSVQKDYEKAVPVLRRAVELRPDLTTPRYQLGSALFETDHFAEAAAQYESTLKQLPEWAEARFSLATTYARLERMPDAIREYKRVIAERPNHYGAHLLLGRALALTGSPEEALPLFNKAIALQPESPEPHRFLADAYAQLGREQEAQRERAEAERIGANLRR
jgi:choline-sulfatase